MKTAIVKDRPAADTLGHELTRADLGLRVLDRRGASDTLGAVARGEVALWELGPRRVAELASRARELKNSAVERGDTPRAAACAEAAVFLSTALEAPGNSDSRKTMVLDRKGPSDRIGHIYYGASPITELNPKNFPELIARAKELSSDYRGKNDEAKAVACERVADYLSQFVNPSGFITLGKGKK